MGVWAVTSYDQSLVRSWSTVEDDLVWKDNPPDLAPVSDASTMATDFMLIRADPDDIVLGPPKTTFASAASMRGVSKSSEPSDRAARETESKDRFAFRTKPSDVEAERLRDKPGNIRSKKADTEQDSDGWSTVKPRKSFGTEGAERFNGRMGVDRHRDERRSKGREEMEGRERPQRGFNSFSLPKDEHDASRRNGAGRGRHEPSWFKDEEGTMPRDRATSERHTERHRGWREKEDKERGGRGDRGDRRWERDRDARQECEPEWMDEPFEGKQQAHTQEDFQKWKEQMQGREAPAVKGADAEENLAKVDLSGQAAFFGLESEAKSNVEAPQPLDKGPDKFFGLWSAKAEAKLNAGHEVKSDIPVSKPTGKSSRFTSFFIPQEEEFRGQSTSLDSAPPLPTQPAANGLAALFSGASNNGQDQAEKDAFQALLSKLHRQHDAGVGSTPPLHSTQQHPSPHEHVDVANAVDHPRQRPIPVEASSMPGHMSPSNLHEILSQRHSAAAQPHVRPDQILNDLLLSRQNTQSQSSARPDQAERRPSNADFLMGLMQSGAKGMPPPRAHEQLVPRNIAGPSSMHVERQLQQERVSNQLLLEREQEIQREAMARREATMHQQTLRRPPPPGFYDESPGDFRRGPPSQHEPAQPVRISQPQPTQILQRPPPGLEQLPASWNHGPAGPPSQQQQAPPPSHMRNGPPPGLAARVPGPAGPHGLPPPLPQGMFPPGFPMAGFGPPPPPPEGMGRMQPPPGFFGPPPPGFLPPGMGLGPGVGMDGAPGLGSFDGRMGPVQVPPPQPHGHGQPGVPAGYRHA